MSFYPGEIRMYAGPTAPDKWAFCDGRLLNINDYDMLYNMIGSFYGGDGFQTFALPDLRGRVPMHINPVKGGGINLADQGGQETVTLTTNNMPSHTHTVMAIKGPATTVNPDKMMMAKTAVNTYVNDVTTPKVAFSNKTLNTVGGAPAPVSIIQPYIAINYIILLTTL